jgi:UDP-N-acetylglucosamine acyltransferase
MAIHTTATIHPSAIIEEGAIIGKNCNVGAYSIIGKNVELSKNVIIKNHVVIESNTFVGQNSLIDNHCLIGSVPNNIKSYDSNDNYLKIGENCVFHTFVGIDAGKTITEIGNFCIFMGRSGLGHDSKIMNRVVFSPYSFANGNCVIHDNCVLGANSTIHQNCVMGTGSMIGASSYSAKNILPYSIVTHNPSKLLGANLVGMKRNSISNKTTLKIHYAYKSSNSVDQIKSLLESYESSSQEIKTIIDFIKTNTKRGYAV